MLLNGPAWFLIADGRRARLLIELRRGADLQQSWTETINDEDMYDPQDRPPRSFDRVGAGRHAMDKGRSLHEQEELNFLKRIASKITEAERQNDFDHLVIAAPPRAPCANCSPTAFTHASAQKRQRISSTKRKRNCVSA